MFAYLCKGQTADTIQTIASNMHKSKEKNIIQITEVGTCCTRLHSTACRNNNLSICLMQSRTRKLYFVPPYLLQGRRLMQENILKVIFIL